MKKDERIDCSDSQSKSKENGSLETSGNKKSFRKPVGSIFVRNFLFRGKFAPELEIFDFRANFLFRRKSCDFPFPPKIHASIGNVNRV